MTTSAAFAKWVDIFTEMFSARERDDMQHAPTTIIHETTETEPNPPTEEAKTAARLRRFYTYWSLKEAYIKMVGEGLLASWLRELEFTDVVPPPLPAPTPHFHSTSTDQPEESWGPTIHSATIENTSSFKISLRQQPVHDVSMSLAAYSSTFIIATATKGISPSPSAPDPKWCHIDIEQDIRPCAEGRCDCPLLR
jgi:4'-phosphopantetheinyl transferase